MKILHAIRSVDPSTGGPIEALKQLARAVAKLGHCIEVVTLDPPNSEWLSAFPLKVYALGPSLGNYGYNPRLVPWLKANAGRYDAVVINGIWSYISLGTWRALRCTKTPYFLFTHGMLDPWFKVAYPLKHVKKSLYWPFADFRVCRDARAVLFTAEEEMRQARRCFRQYTCTERVISYGTAGPEGDQQAQRETFYERYPELRGKRVLLFLGRLHPKKGCDLLVQAFAAVASRDETLQLVMAGPDQENWRPRLEAMALQAGVADRVSWTGMLKGDLKWGAFFSGEAFALPSHQENFGVSVAEALACGLPVLISDKVNIWREIQDDEAGIISSDTAEGMKAALNQWLNLTADERLRFRVNAQRCFANRFEISRAGESYIKTIEQGISNASGNE